MKETPCKLIAVPLGVIHEKTGIMALNSELRDPFHRKGANVIKF